MLKQAEGKGYLIKTGVECEYFLLSADAHEISDNRDRATKPCYKETDEDLELSPLAYQFIGGILESASAVKA